MRINNTGNFEYCRWALKDDRQQGQSIATTTPIQWFQQGMSATRTALLDGKSLPGCADCHTMERYEKISGRKKQLLKTGVTLEDFEKSMLSSPWLDEFRHSQEHQGHTNQLPQDWQIDLGNFCNSACVFCNPFSSSRLAEEFKRIGLIKQVPPRPWCDDPVLLQSFIDVLKQTPHLAYLHFLGGETIITPAFRTILQALIDVGLNKKVSIGFTTNLTIWDQSIVDMLTQFREVNLGMSIECLHPLNDYVRYGSKLSDVIDILDKWVSFNARDNWFLQLRITPTILSIWHLDTVYHYAMKNNLAVESCNFLKDPEFMRPSVLPRSYREQVIEKLHRFIGAGTARDAAKIINSRDPNVAVQQVLEDAQSYVNYLEEHVDESARLPDLINYLSRLEQTRKNRILEYLPEYEELFRTAGYRPQD